MIRPALPLDADALAHFGARLFRETYTGRVPDSDIARHIFDTFQPAALLADLENPGHAWLVVEGPVGFQGYAHLRPSPPPVSSAFEHTIELARFYVDSPHQGTGLAQELFTAVRTWARNHGHDALWLQVWEQSPQARRFYAKQGLQDIGAATYQVGTITYHDRVLAERL